MKKTCHVAKSAPAALGPYSHAVSYNGLLFVSGQVALHPDGTPCRDSFEAEALRALENLKTVVEECGSSLDRVVKTMIFLADMDDFQAFNAIYAEFFKEQCPARSCMQAARLPANFRVEIEAIAALDT